MHLFRSILPVYALLTFTLAALAQISDLEHVQEGRSFIRVSACSRDPLQCLVLAFSHH